MAKSEKKREVKLADIQPPGPMPQTGCVICGSYDAPFEQITENARVHAACATARPDVVAKVKARA